MKSDKKCPKCKGSPIHELTSTKHRFDYGRRVVSSVCGGCNGEGTYKAYATRKLMGDDLDCVNYQIVNYPE